MEFSTDILKSYHDRQVVLNYYDDRELVERKGFTFSRVKLTEKEILFCIPNGIDYQIPTSSHVSFQRNSQFPNYYELFFSNSRIEIYFP
ncbi:hypothetical protein RZN22_04005 [Bacillaceae bacterium S4-13-58]